MPNQLFSASYSVEHQNRTGSNTYECTLVFFDDHSCTRTLMHNMYDCEPPFGGESTSHACYEGRWRVASSAERGELIHIEETALERTRHVSSGSGGDQEHQGQQERVAEKILPITVELEPLLDGYIIGEHTGAPRRLKLIKDWPSDERRSTSGDADAFLAFIRGRDYTLPEGRLFSARYLLEYQTDASDHAYTCKLSFFDDMTCARELTYYDHYGLHSDPPMEGERATIKTSFGQWKVTRQAEQELYTIHIEESAPVAFHRPGLSAAEAERSDKHTEGLAPIKVKVRELLSGHIRGENIGAPERPWGGSARIGVSDQRHHEGDSAAFMAFLQRHATDEETAS